MSSKAHQQLLGYALTDDPELADHKHHYSEEIGYLLAEAHRQVEKAKPSFLPKLLKLVDKYPRVPDFRNLLSVYYSLRNKPEKSLETNLRTVERFPDFLFGRTNLALTYLDEAQYHEVPKIIGEALNLQALYPERKLFHYHEFAPFELVVCRYLIGTGALEEAESRLEIAEQVAPEAENWAHLRFLITNKKLMNKLSPFSKKQQGGLPGLSNDRNIQTYEEPDLHHPELEVLYENTLDIPRETLQKLLELPRETLIADLEAVLQDSVQRLEYFQAMIADMGWIEERMTFPLHALFLLTELRAADALPTLLDCLRRGESYLDLWYGDHLFETWWHFIYQLGQDQLPLLQEFVQEPDLYYGGKAVVSQAVQQIGLHQPERASEVLDWYEHSLQHFLSNPNDADSWDEDVIAAFVADAIPLKGSKRLLPLIQQFYEMELIDESFVGTYAEVEKNMLEGIERSEKQQVFEHVFDHYQHIHDSWLSSALEVDPWADAERLPPLPAEYKKKEAALPKVTPAGSKVGRNDPCPCGSGRKYKRCCWGKE